MWAKVTSKLPSGREGGWFSPKETGCILLPTSDETPLELKGALQTPEVNETGWSDSLADIRSFESSGSGGDASYFSVDGTWVEWDEEGATPKGKENMLPRTALLILAIISLLSILVITDRSPHSIIPTLLEQLQASSHQKHLVERNPNITFTNYLRSQFPDRNEVVMWTFATGSYVNAIRNWDARRAELGMKDSVVTICLDVECLDMLEKLGHMRAYGGWLIEYIDLPPANKRLGKRGPEREQYMGFCKFKGLLEINEAGYNSLFFEGDTFFTANPFDHMRPLSNPDWDMQFTEDMGHVVNFGWIFMRASESTMRLWKSVFYEYGRRNGWDQDVLSNHIRSEGGREVKLSIGTVNEHWWIIDSMALRMYLLPITDFLAYHTMSLGWYQPDPAKPAPIMQHLTSILLPNRNFFPKEKGWWTNLDGFYTTPRPIVTSGPLNGTEADIKAASRLLNIVASTTKRAFKVPSLVTIHANNETYARAYSRVMSLDAADHEHLDMLEPDFFEHAKKYLSEPSLTYWSAPAIRLDIGQFSSPQDLIEHIKRRRENPFEVLELFGFEQPAVKAWSFDNVKVYSGFKTISACQEYSNDRLPFLWCTSKGD